MFRGATVYVSATFTTTSQFLAADGTSGAPGYSFSASPTVGMYRDSGVGLAFSVGGAVFGLAAAGAVLPAASTLVWTSGALTASADTGITRTAAGAVAIGNGSAADKSGSLALSLFNLAGIETGLTAHAGGTQGAALGLSATKSVHNVSTVGTAADSVALPAATGSGQMHFVKNSAAVNAMQVFAVSPGTIDGVATGTGVSVVAGKGRLFVDIATNVYVSIIGA